MYYAFLEVGLSYAEDAEDVEGSHGQTARLYHAPEFEWWSNVVGQSSW